MSMYRTYGNTIHAIIDRHWALGLEKNSDNKTHLNVLVKDHISKITLKSRVHGIAKERKLFTEDEELMIVAQVQLQYRMGFGVNERLVGEFCASVARKCGRTLPSVDGVPGEAYVCQGSFIRGLYKRHPSLKAMKTSPIDSKRAGKATDEVRERWFAMVEEVRQ
jgi:hypothetical protein